MILHLGIDTHDNKLAFDLVNSTTVGPGTSASVPGPATLTISEMHMRKAFGIPETLDVVLSFGTGVASGVLANWIYDKLRNRAVTLRIEETEVDLDAGEITRIITRTTERKE
jgi:hypothetical protein